MSSNGAQSQPRLDGDDASKIPSEQVHIDPAAATPNGVQPGKEAVDLTSLNLELSSLALHADDKHNVFTDVAPPIHLTTTYRYSSDPKQLIPWYERGSELQSEETSSEYIYSRESSAGGTRFESLVSAYLKAPSLAYSSGLSAFHAILTHLVPKRVAIGDGYHGCHGVLSIYKRLTGCEILDLDCPPESLSEGDLVWLETPVNPYGTTFNIQHYADIAHSRGAYLGVDSTFAPPPLQNPFNHGADVVMHSGTKYIGGHSDMLCGIVATTPDKRGQTWLDAMKADRVFLGSVMGSMENWLGTRSIRTLELRVTRQSESAGKLVDALDGGLTGATVGTGLSSSDVSTIQKTVLELHHASLQPADDLRGYLRKQMPNGFGAVFCITLKSPDLAKTLPSKLKLFHHATSLGGVESLIEWRTMSDDTVDKKLLRVSVGVEDSRDLLDDLLRGLRELVDQFKL